MLFSTPFFLFVFLPVFFLIYHLAAPKRWVLLAGSLLFYGWSEPVFLGVVVASACLDWGLGWLIAGHQRRAKFWTALGIAGNVGILLYAKYTIFAFENLNVIFQAVAMPLLEIPKIALPLGVSFIVFEKITYLVDLYRGKAQPARSLLDYLNYVFLFPKLLAGPIVKYHDIATQLASPSHKFNDLRDGLIRFCFGLAKKVLIADQLAPFVDQAFAVKGGDLDAATAWLGILCFSMQIYFDFSGYSDMAIGMGRMLGFRLLENFNNPYLATSITDFWRRWHISLSSWIKEYLYIPLGGSRVPLWRAYFNLCLCFFLSGLWHGAAWTFVIWGCMHGLALVADRIFWLKFQERLPAWVSRILTFLFVMVSWVFFRSESLPKAVVYLKSMCGAFGRAAHDAFLQADTLFFLVAGAILILKPLVAVGRGTYGEAEVRKSRNGALLASGVLLILCVARLAVSTFNPFLYFQF